MAKTQVDKKKTFCCNPPFDKKCFFLFLSCFFGNQKHWCWTKKHNLKSGNSKDKKKELERKKDWKPEKKEKLLMKKKTCNWIFWCCSFHERKAKKKEKQRKKPKQGTKRKQETKTRRNKERKEEKRETEKEKQKKREAKKAKGERKRNTENKQKIPFSRGENKVFCINNQKTKTKYKKKQKQIRRV